MSRLSKETSPYLLQHAHNPVDWYPWGEEAFARARAENKPILVSIGYSTCHWCHVMERESFEDEFTAAYMNAHFVNIKIDREERPDIDQIYMEAVQALTQSGGWPLNCFLLPDLRPFHGGTYFPPRAAYGRPSWMQVLKGVVDAFQHKHDLLEKQANRLLDFMVGADDQFMQEVVSHESSDKVFTPVWATNTFHALMKHADVELGGFGAAPKFPSTMLLKFLLDYYHHFQDASALHHLELSLDRMIAGGIYDQLGGGLARYSTDAEWLAPHFEKMLYDNALFVSILAETYLVTQKESYLETIHETMAWLQREMYREDGGFYSALDADTEGEEGKFYVWSAREVRELLGDDAPIFSAYLDVRPDGNWEGKNVLRRMMPAEELAQSIGWEAAPFKKVLQKWKDRLFLEREKRPRPGLDDKILLDWNALMCRACCLAYRATDHQPYLEMAERNVNFVYAKMKNGGGFHHTYKDGVSKYDAFLNDYAYLAEALLTLYQTTFSDGYLHDAKCVVDYAIAHFKDTDGPSFYFSTAGAADVLVRKKDVYDNALPSGNAVMAANLQQLAALTGEMAYKRQATELLRAMAESVERYPRSFSRWATVMLNEVFPIREFGIVGANALPLAKALNRRYIPNKVIMAALEENDAFPLIKGRGVPGATKIYECSDFVCETPVDGVDGVSAR